MTERNQRTARDPEGLNTAAWPASGDHFVTPVDLFFTRSHAPIPHIDPLGLYAGWPGVHTRDLRTFAEALITGELDPLDPRLLAMR